MFSSNNETESNYENESDYETKSDYENKADYESESYYENESDYEDEFKKLILELVDQYNFKELLHIYYEKHIFHYSSQSSKFFRELLEDYLRTLVGEYHVKEIINIYYDKKLYEDSRRTYSFGSEYGGRGSLIELTTYGAQDIFLNVNHLTSFFSQTYKRHNNFTIEGIDVKLLDDSKSLHGKKLKPSIQYKNNQSIQYKNKSSFQYKNKSSFQYKNKNR